MSGLIIPGQINDLFEVTTDLIEEYDSIKDLRGLPEAFQEVNKQLSLVEQTLRNVKTPAKKLKSASDTLALGTLLDNCDQRAENLREIFRSIAKKSNGQYDPSVYRATLMKQGKRRVETLMDGMLEDLGIFLAHPMFPAEIHEQVGPFAKAREELIKVSASLHDSDLDEQPGTVSQYGDNNRQYNLSGEGRQNIVDGHYFEAKGDQNFGEDRLTLVIVLFQSAPMKKTEIRNCLRDLRLTDPLEDRNILKRKKGNHAHGTCEWIIRTKEITAWLESEQENILWLYGYPGTGKSTMAIFLTEELSRVFSTTEGKTLAYFFCDSGDEKRKTATSIIRGLLLQLVEQCPPLLDYLLSKYNDRGPEVFQTFDALWPIFMAAVVDQSTGRKYCIIDALDECDEGSQETLLMQLEETLSNSAFTSNIRILVTSRPYPLIDGYLRRFAAKDLGSFPERKEDIDLYIKERLENLSERQHYTAKVREKASKILREKAGGTFLWVGLACEELRGTPSNRLFQALESIPEGLDSLYKELLDAALQQKWAREKTIRHILSFVAFSLRPLSVLEISEACQLHLDEDDPDTREQYTREDIASCRLMVIIQDGEVQLLHQSVRDYLERTRHLDKLEEHANLAYRCIDLLMKEFHCIEPGPIYFSDYAAHNWPNHARMAESKFVISGSRAQFFDVDSPCRTQWLARLRRKDRFLNRISDFSLWHIAARWGLSTLARYLHNKASQMKCLDISNYVSSEGVTPLELAAQSQYPDVISVLLKLGGKLTTRVLKAAARNEETGKEVMVLLLIHCEDHLTITEEVLMAAAGNRVNAEGVMKLLLDHPGEYITITNRVVNAAISNWGNAEGVTRLLLDYRRDQFSITKYMIEAAARNRGNGEGVMKLLLDRRGDQFTITEGVVKAAAGNWGNGEGVMKLLLDRRGDQFTITEEVVKAAAGNWGNGDRVMKLLLDRRGDQFTITEEVIKAAARNRGNGEGMMKLLLNRRGDQVTITEEVVKAAAGNRGDGEGVVKVLLDHPGEKITITDGMINTAAKNRINGDSVMKLLLEHFERRENLISP